MVLMRKIEMYVINLGDKLSEEEMKEVLDQSLHGTAITCSVRFGEIKEKDIGEWHDDIKFNLRNTPIEEYRKEFALSKPRNKVD